MAAIDRIYVAASSLDARLTRICVASVRRFYPTIPLALLAGGRLQPGLAGEMAKHWDVDLADVPQGQYGWGFVKLEPLFGLRSERFLMLDSDTVMTGPVIGEWYDSQAPFLVAREEYDDVAFRNHFYDWRGIREIDPAAQPPRFGFNSGHWIGRTGVLNREMFTPWIAWELPRRLTHPHLFFPGDQGVFNYVINQQCVTKALVVDRRPEFLWPGRGLEGVSADGIRHGSTPPLIVHWAGLKTADFRNMAGHDVLTLFEDAYYSVVPKHRRLIAHGVDRFTQAKTRIARRVRRAVSRA
jgi:hypothetical protein